MPYSDRDIQQRQALLQGQVSNIPLPTNANNLLTQLDDVSIGSEDGAAPLASGDVLTWVPAEYAWENKVPHYVPAGGSGGQVLTKIDATDYNVDWETPAGSGFPVGPDDDGTATASITWGTVLGSSQPGALAVAVQDDATPTNFAYLLVFDPPVSGTAASLRATAGSITIQSDNNDVSILANGGGNVQIDGSNIGFYGVTPVAKAGTPTTLADVITILQNLGLCT